MNKVSARLVYGLVIVSMLLFGNFGRVAHASTITVDDRAGVLGSGRARIEAAAAKLRFPLAVYTRQSLANHDDIAVMFRSHTGLTSDTLIYAFDAQQRTLYSGMPVVASANTEDVLAEIDDMPVKPGQNVADIIAAQLDAYAQTESRSDSPEYGFLNFIMSLTHGWGLYVVLGILAVLATVSIYLRFAYGRSLRFGLLMLLIEGLARILAYVRQRFVPDQPHPLSHNLSPQQSTPPTPPVFIPAPAPPVVPFEQQVHFQPRTSMVTDNEWQALMGTSLTPPSALPAPNDDDEWDWVDDLLAATPDTGLQSGHRGIDANRSAEGS